jgi:hypothetical protein
MIKDISIWLMHNTDLESDKIAELGKYIIENHLIEDNDWQWGVIYSAIPYNVDDIVLPDWTREEIANCVNEELNKQKIKRYEK